MNTYKSFLTSIFVFASCLLFGQSENFNIMMPHLDGAAINLIYGAPLKVKFDERHLEYTLNTSDILVYESANNPLAGAVTSVTNALATGAVIKRGVNLLEITFSNTVLTGNKYYILEIKDSKGESSFLRFLILS